MTGPDRIWAWTSGQAAGLFDTSFHDDRANATEYVRADLCEASIILAEVTKERGWDRVLLIDNTLIDANLVMEALKRWSNQKGL